MSNTLQRDFFQSTAAAAIREKTQANEKEPAFLERFRVSVRLDQAMVGVIGLLVLYAMVFSWGVEKGKQIVRAEWSVAQSVEAAALEQSQAEQAVKTDEVESLTGEKALAEPDANPSAGKAEPVSGSTELSDVTRDRPLGKYTIQVITYKWQAAAERRAKELATKGLTAYVIPSGQYFLVCVESFESKEKARFALTQLKMQKFIPGDAYIRPVTVS